MHGTEYKPANVFTSVKKWLTGNWGIFLIIVLVTLFIRLIGINKVGRAWDEYAYVGVGDDLVHLVAGGNFTDPEWYTFPDHPAVSRYLYGLAGQFSVVDRDADGKAIFAYDWTAPRVLSALFGALTAGYVFLIGRKLWSAQVGIASAVIFMLLPLAIGYAQLITLESINMFLTAAGIFYFLQFLEVKNWLQAVVSGVLLGLALGTKYTNVILGLTYGGIWLVHSLQGLESLKNIFSKIIKNIDLKLLSIPVIALVIFYVLWPALWFHPTETFQNIVHWSQQRMQPPSEYYFGTYGPVPWHYYLGSLLVTTPVVVLALLCGAGYYFYKNKKDRYALLVLIVCLFVPLLLSFYPLKQNGIRYVIMIYPAISLLAGYAWTALNKQLEKINQELPYYLSTLIVGSLILSLYLIYPYYLDYYNFLTGGNTKVYEQKLFELAFWGQGQREALIAISKVAQPGSTVGLAVIPDYVAPTMQGLPTGIYNSTFEFDYVVTNAMREFQTPIIQELTERQYVPVHYVTAGGAPIVTIYAKKSIAQQLLIPDLRL